MLEESTDMDLKTFLDEMDSGHEAVTGSDVHLFMRRLSQEALKVTMCMNTVGGVPARTTGSVETARRCHP